MWHPHPCLHISSYLVIITSVRSSALYVPNAVAFTPLEVQLLPGPISELILDNALLGHMRYEWLRNVRPALPCHKY